jgi:F-type H+-transporting ATPase subunit gamma
MKAIKRRRSTVKNIQQITKAMNLVATSKLQRARNGLATVAQPTQAAFDIAYNTINSPEAREQLFIQPRKDVRTTAYLVLTSNRGLCGSYNSNVCKELLKHAKEHNKNPLIIPVGTKGRDYFRRRNLLVQESDAAMADQPSFKEAAMIVEELMSMYQNGRVDEVYVVYTKFVTVLSQEPVVKPLLPINPDFLRLVIGTALKEGEEWEDLGFFKRPEATNENSQNVEVEYDPSLEEVLAGVIPWYLNMFLSAALASATLCEQASRMTSMDSATSNAGDIIEKLTLMFNRQRQSIITQEITEIVSGANALQ